MSVFAKLQKVRKEFSQTEIKKSGHNTFSKYDYFELTDFLPMAQIKFEASGLCPVVTFPDREMARLTVYDAEKPDDFVVFECPVGIPDVKGMNAAQAVGAAQTYARRYLYINALELSEHDPVEDPDNLSEISVLKTQIGELIGQIQKKDKKYRGEIADILRSIIKTADYTKALKNGMEDKAKEIIEHLEALLSDITKEEGKNE